MTPFDYLNSITATKIDIITNPEEEKGYNAFIVNKGLSYYQDTILLANEMNTHYYLDKKLQYDFLFDMVRRNKRYPKWLKPTKHKDLECVMAYYDYSELKANQALKLLDEDELKYIREMTKHMDISKK